MINENLLNLHFAQLIQAWKHAKYNNYSDSRKQIYHENLSELFNSLKETDFVKLAPGERLEIKKIINFFIDSLTILNSSTLNNLPYELVSCLRYAMNEWIDDSDSYIIVTSYAAKYSFNLPVSTSEIYEIISKRYGITFNKRLVQISLPRHLERDYLTNTVMYHELGHFIDSILVCNEPILEKIWNIRDSPECQLYFPHFSKTKHEGHEKRPAWLRNHIKEYFADLFSCQYIGAAAIDYLSYISSNTKLYTMSHPPTAKRIDLMINFLIGKDDQIMQIFCDEVFAKTSRRLEKRSEPLNSDDILNLIPCIINNEKQLHTLFSESWKIWLEKSGEFQKKNKMVCALKPSQIYQVLNNLIEKSINNFIATKKWQESKPNPMAHT